MRCLALTMLSRRLGSSTLAEDRLFWRSSEDPNLLISILDIVQRGQGHIPLSRILAIRILRWRYMKFLKENGLHSLFWVICRIREDARIKPSKDTISTTDNSPMFPCMDKFIIDKSFHLFVKKFSSAVRVELICWPFPTSKLRCKVVEGRG